MPVALTAYNEPFGKDLSSQRIWLHGVLTFTAGNYVTGGILPVYSTILDQSGQKVQLATYNVAPDTMYVQSIAGAATGQYIYSYNKATGKIQIWVTGAALSGPLAEYTNGTAITPIIADVVEFEAQWVKL